MVTRSHDSDQASLRRQPNTDGMCVHDVLVSGPAQAADDMRTVAQPRVSHNYVYVPSWRYIAHLLKAGSLLPPEGEWTQITRAAFGVSGAAPPANEEIFGRVARDDAALVPKLQAVGVYSEVAVGPSTEVPGAADLYRAQRDLFKGAAKSLNDGRKGAFAGKILRRVEITRVELLDS